MRVTTSWMARKYSEFNEKYFGGQLPRNVTFNTNMERAWGRAFVSWKRVWDGWKYKVEGFDYKIFMSNQYDSPENIRENTLMHEMIHIADYYFHPEHFVTYSGGKWHKIKGYDAHGYVFFMRMADKFKQYGFEIQRYVSEEERAASQLGTEMAARVAKGYILGFLICDPSYGVINDYNKPNLMFKVASKAGLAPIVEMIDELSKTSRKWRGTFKKIIAGTCTSPDFANMTMCRSRITGKYMSDGDMNDIISKNNMKMGTVWEDTKGLVREGTEEMVQEPIDGENGVFTRATKNFVQYTMV